VTPSSLPNPLSSRLAAQQRLRQSRPDQARIKVNLYTDAETRAVAVALAELERDGEPSRVDCVMVGDSYLMTHLGRASTRIEDEAEQAEVFEMMLGLVRGVAREVASLPGDPRPWLLADLPDGAVATHAKAIDSIARMIDAGADAVKVEVLTPAVFDVIADAASRGAATVAHIGYKPQTGANRKYGDTEEEALSLLGEARRAREAGAVGLVLERVSQPVMGLISRTHDRSLPVWSIFCGQAPGAGQSLNVFDSVIRPSFAAFGFPPTSTLERTQFPQAYSEAVIATHFAALLRLAYAGTFPPRLASRLDPSALARLADIDVWG
jgi:ketopantoate hydroxymethyltransferase